MSLRAEYFTRKVALVLMLALGLALVLAPAAQAQDDQPVPKVEVFAGYAWMDPGGDACINTGPFTVSCMHLKSIPSGLGTSGTFNVDDHWGLTVDFGAHWGPNSTIYTFMAGPQFKWRREHISPFLHALVGAHHLNNSDNLGIGLAAGGGLDIHVNRWLDFRLIEADYVYSHHNFAPNPSINMNGGRLRTGLLFKFGGAPPPPKSCSVSVQPMEVMAGEPVSVTANTVNFNPGHTLNYSWNTNGGKVSGSGMGASVDTAGMAPGSYNVSAQVTDKKASASCSASFTVKEPPRNPPQISCSANPATVKSGESSTINCSCTSPDNRSLSYSWTTNSGQLSGSGASAQLDTAGLGSGAVSVGTTCTDDRGLTDATTTMVTVEAPPPMPEPIKVGECDFTTARVDNTCKAVLDDVALRMQRDADAKLVIVGYSADNENKRVAAQRATNSKAYLVNEKGIDASRIELRTGMGGGTRAEYILVPAGATFSDANTEMVMGK